MQILRVCKFRVRTIDYSIQNLSADVSILRPQQRCTAIYLCYLQIEFWIMVSVRRIWHSRFRVQTTAVKTTSETCQCFVRREFAMQVPALSIAWMEQNLNSKKISKGLKRTIGTIQAQAQESWWTSCKKPAHAPDSQNSQDFLELSGKLLTKLHFFLGNLGPLQVLCPLCLGILSVCSAGFVSLLNASVEFMHKPKISKNPVG